MTTKVITGKDTRFSYLNANEPKAINGSKPKYSVSLIISKDVKLKQQLNKPIKKVNLN